MCPRQPVQQLGTTTTTIPDDLSGKPLNPERVKKARREEMEEFRKHGVYNKIPVGRAWEATGKKPIAVRWVDINKGDDVNPDYRSRLVAKEINKFTDLSLFAATPPWESIKLLFSLAVTQGIGWSVSRKAAKKIDSADVRRAYFHATAKRQFVCRPPGRGPLDRQLWGAAEEYVWNP